MDKSDLDSGSGSGSDSETNKELNSNDSVDDTIDDLMDDSDDDDFEEEDDDEEDMVDSDSDGHNPMSNWLGITPASIRKQVLKIHEERKVKAKNFLKDFQGKFTLSYEWLLLNNLGHIRGPIKNEDFTCITAHFIDDNWKVRKWILGYTTDASIPLDDLYIYHFRTAVQSFEIGSKVSTILLPNHEDFDAATVVAIRKCMGEEEGASAISPPVFVVYCCADLFRLMADDLSHRFRWTLYEELRMLVGWGRCFSSPNWNVMLYHYQLAVDMKKEDAFSKDEIYDDYDKPSDEEWMKIETYCKLGGCVYKVAKELFEEGYSTSNVYFHLLAELKVMLKREVDGGESEYFIRKGKKMLKMFDKYWGDMFLVLATASVLDPRFKMKYVEFYCSKKIEDDEGSKAETVLDYLRSLFARYAASEICQKPICSVETVDPEEDEDEDYGDDDEEEAEEGKEEKEKPDAYKDFVLFQEFLKFEESPREFAESELDAYLKEPIMEWNKDFKALEWWKEESQKYPVLSRVARDILSIPISRASSYDAYVADKREPPENDLSMDAKAANAVMCGRSWLPLIR